MKEYSEGRAKSHGKPLRVSITAPGAEGTGDMHLDGLQNCCWPAVLHAFWSLLSDESVCCGYLMLISLVYGEKQFVSSVHRSSDLEEKYPSILTWTWFRRQVPGPWAWDCCYNRMRPWGVIEEGESILHVEHSEPLGTREQTIAICFTGGPSKQCFLVVTALPNALPMNLV